MSDAVERLREELRLQIQGGGIVVAARCDALSALIAERDELLEAAKGMITGFAKDPDDEMDAYDNLNFAIRRADGEP